VDESNPRYEGWRVVAGSSLAVFFAAAPFNTFAVFLKPVSEEFSWSRETASSAFGVLALGAAVSAPVLGRLLDWLGARRIILTCLAVSGSVVASLGGLTPSLLHLYVVFAVLGVATIGTSPIAHSRVIFSWFERRRGRALGLMLAGASVGGLVLPPLMQALIRAWGWRVAWFTLGASALAIGVPAVVRFSRERASPALGGRAVQAAGASVRDALRSRVFWTLLVVVFASTIALNGTIVHLSALLTDRGLPASQAALAISVMNGASLAGRLVTGWLLDRYSAARVSVLLLTAAAFGAFLLSDAQSFAAGALAAMLIGFGTGGESDITPYLLSRFFGLRSMSTLYGLNWTAWGFAAITGPVLMGRAFDGTGSYDVVLVQFALVTLAAAALMLTVPPVRPRMESTATA
jgi:MFS family permease